MFCCSKKSCRNLLSDNDVIYFRELRNYSHMISLESLNSQNSLFDDRKKYCKNHNLVEMCQIYGCPHFIYKIDFDKINSKHKFNDKYVCISHLEDVIPSIFENKPIVEELSDTYKNIIKMNDEYRREKLDVVKDNIILYSKKIFDLVSNV